MFSQRLIALFVSIYAGLRVFSYWFGPTTPLFASHWLNAVVGAIALVVVAGLFIKRDVRAWYIITLEIILGGSGNFIEVADTSLRTWFVIVGIVGFLGQLLYERHLTAWWQQEKRPILYIGALWIAVGISAVVGYRNQHSLQLIIADAIPYLFFFYYFPLATLWRDQTFRRLGGNALVATIIGNTIFMLGTFIGFSSGLFVLQDTYYHWFRDIASGKITELGHYYRLVLNEQLLLIPVLLYSLAQVLKKNITRLWVAMSALGLVILTMNITRIYMVALVFGYLCLFTKLDWQRWLKTGCLIALFFIGSFTTLHVISSRGTSLGWELFGVRLGSIVAPASEESSLSRLLLLPNIIEKIKTTLFIGSGLGDTVTVYSPVHKKIVTTPHFDWGYLEMLAELGIIGWFFWWKLLQFAIERIRSSVALGWPLASLGALLVINITAPALFHVLGIVWLTILLNKKIA